MTRAAFEAALEALGFKYRGAAPYDYWIRRDASRTETLVTVDIHGTHARAGRDSRPNWKSFEELLTEVST